MRFIRGTIMYVHYELQEDKGSWEAVSAVGPSSEGGKCTAFCRSQTPGSSRSDQNTCWDRCTGKVDGPSTAIYDKFPYELSNPPSGNR